MIRQGLHIIAGSPSPNTNEKKAIELTKSAYEQLVADGLVEKDQNYIIIDDEAPNIIDDTLSSYDNVYSAAHTLGLINTLKENVYTKSETESAINRKLISAIKYKGKVAEAENLPSLAENGDAYYVTGESLLYIYNEDLANYEALGDIVDLSAYLAEEEILELLKEKNIKFQYAEMPEASSEFDYPIQYIGATTENYKLGSWYRSVSNSGTYAWEELLIEGKNKDPFETDTIPETAENGTTHLYIGTDNANYKKGHVYQYNDSSWNDITAGTIQLKILPTANENELNKIYQYIGVSNSNYTNGYFYECVESNNSYAWVEKEVQKNNDVPHWTGTHAEYETQKDTIPDYAILHFTDDYDDSVGVVDKIEANNMSAVTSNAVARLGTVYSKTITPSDRFPALSSTSSPNRRTIISIPVPAGVYLVTVCGRVGDVNCPDCSAAWPILNGNIQWCAGYVINSTEIGNLKNMRYFNYNNTAIVTKATAGDIILEEYFEGSVPEHYYLLNMYAVLLRTVD